MVHPTFLANQCFLDAETLMRKKSDSLKSEDNIGNKLTKTIVDYISTNYKNAPKCHLNVIFARFIKARWHFWAKNTDEDEQKESSCKKDIKAEAGSSKTSKRMVTVK